MSVAALVEQLFEAGRPPCFAVLDAARSEEIDRLTLGFEMRFLYLLDGVVDPLLARCAPRVVELGTASSPGLERLLERGFGHSWGYFARSGAGLLDVRDQLASLLEAELPDESVVRFRIFDPRVLRVYLPTCEGVERTRVHGPIEEFLIEPEAAGGANDVGARFESHRHEEPPMLRPPGATLPRLCVRGEQLRALNGASRAKFDTRALAHLRRYFPAQCEALGDEQIRGVITHGIERAGRHGLVTEAEICKYLNLMFSFGRNFDTEQSWAVRVLAGGNRGEGSLIERLYGLALVNDNRALGRV